MKPRSASPQERSAITDAIRNQLEKHPEMLWAYLHGSFLEPGPYRDIDVAVWVDPRRAAPSDWRRYELDLSVALQSVIRQPVDVRVLNDAPLAFRYHVLKGQPLLVRDWDGLDEVRARTWDDYCDFLPFARQYLREVLNA
jgi:predicted nucleotidyltransferase